MKRLSALCQLSGALALFVAALTCLLQPINAAAAAAAAATVAQETDLRDDRYVDANVIAHLKLGTTVDIVKSEAGWVCITFAHKTGWVRANMLSGSGATAAGAATVEGGRSASGNIVATSSIRSMPRTTRHALIIGVGSYADAALTPLSGVQYDIASARSMAVAMSIPEHNMHVLRDQDASKDGIARAISALNEQVRAGDRVFVYFSGYGTQVPEQVGTAGASTSNCADAFVASDSRAVSSTELAAWLSPIMDKADKLMFFYDAGMSAAQVPTGSKSKFLASMAGACAQTDKTVGSDFFAHALRQGALAQNLVQIAAARHEEMVPDDEKNGGITTQAWRDCMAGDARDLDHSGAISMDEIAVCTQQKLQAWQHPGTLLQHVVVSGNQALIPGWFKGAAVAAPSLAAAGSAGKALDDILWQRDARHQVSVRLDSALLNIDKDALHFSVNSSHAGYLYIILLGSDGQSFYMLFPNDVDQNNAIKAGQTVFLPRQSWTVTAQGPAGIDKMLVVVTDAPRAFASVGSARSGPFLTALTDSEGRANLQWLLGTAMYQASALCAHDGKTDAVVQAALSQCSDAFGATLVEIVEQK